MIWGGLITRPMLLRIKAMDFVSTIEKPWREPLNYLSLVFWFVIFVIVAYAMWDTMRVLGTYVVDAATS
jgi:hypothetical protein